MNGLKIPTPFWQADTLAQGQEELWKPKSGARDGGDGG